MPTAKEARGQPPAEDNQANEGNVYQKGLSLGSLFHPIQGKKGTTKDNQHNHGKHPLVKETGQHRRGMDKQQ